MFQFVKDVYTNTRESKSSCKKVKEEDIPHYGVLFAVGRDFLTNKKGPTFSNKNEFGKEKLIRKRK